VERQSVKSSAIRSIGYRESDQTLEVEFDSGRIYQYSGVARSLYEWLLRSPSKGGIFNRMIRDQYPELDVTPVDEQDLEAALRASLRPESGE
jgi:hypothetical protein